MGNQVWIVPAKDEVQKWISLAVVGGANEMGADGLNRLDGETGILKATIDRVRGAIVTGGRVALSLTANSIPPETRRNFWILAIYDLVSSTPQLGNFALKDGFENMWRDAEDWLDEVSKGERIVTSPTDPDTSFTVGVVWGDGAGINTPNKAATRGVAGESVAEPQTTPGKEVMDTDGGQGIVQSQIVDGGGP